MNDRKLMQQALDALELLAKYTPPAVKIQVRARSSGERIVTVYPQKIAADAAAPLRERLAQGDPEPVVWMYQDKSTNEVKFQKHMRAFVDHGATYEVPLYATPVLVHREGDKASFVQYEQPVDRPAYLACNGGSDER